MVDPTTQSANDLILEVKDLSVGFGSGSKRLEVTGNVSFKLHRGEIVSLVGESGCGKSLTCLALTRLLPPGGRIFSGSVEFHHKNGQVYDLATLPEKKLRKLRGSSVAYIFQEPGASLNPVFSVEDQIAEVIELHRQDVDNVHQEVVKLLQDVGIPDPEKRCSAYPHELSGGMQQRIMIAMALAGQPELLIADEPTTALDVTIQSQILDLIDQLRKKYNMAVILITHNLGIVAELADQVEVMYGGNIVESAPAGELLSNARHPYTQALLKAVPRFGMKDQKLNTIPGQVPMPGKFPAGCRFADRCLYAKTQCSQPGIKCQQQGDHLWRCILES
ncbi:MAG: ABC transporter ATP-binding protein [Lentisphaerae bacterium]|nr:ABC transporter ATP-binding protein [Lentisphaerota bacterium]